MYFHHIYNYIYDENTLTLLYTDVSYINVEVWSCASTIPGMTFHQLKIKIKLAAGSLSQVNILSPLPSPFFPHHENSYDYHMPPEQYKFPLDLLILDI